MNVINSPFALLSGSSLTCKLCNSSVKSTKVWTAHVNGKQHREKLLELKRVKAAADGTTNSANISVNLSQKRPATTQNNKNVGDTDAKRRKEIPANFFDDKAVGSKLGKTFAQTTTKTNVLTAAEPPRRTTSSTESSSMNSSSTTVNLLSKQQELVVVASSSSTSSSSADEKYHDLEKIDEPSTSLPEGFFDDKKLDAKARNVETKDTMEDEWKKFQTELIQEQKAADAIIEDEDELLHAERDEDQVREEINKLAKFVKLEQLGAERKAILETVKFEEDEDMQTDDSSLVDFDEFDSWRSKKI